MPRILPRQDLRQGVDRSLAERIPIRASKPFLPRGAPFLCRLELHRQGVQLLQRQLRIPELRLYLVTVVMQCRAGRRKVHNPRLAASMLSQ